MTSGSGRIRSGSTAQPCRSASHAAHASAIRWAVAGGRYPKSCRAITSRSAASTSGAVPKSISATNAPSTSGPA